MPQESALSKLIQTLVIWIERDEKLIESQAQHQWRSYRIDANNVRTDTTDDELRAARERIDNNRRIIDAWERKNSGRN